MPSESHPRDVVVRVFQYRHEAEFAAGFLEDAGIPFRLQADDAGGIDAGMTLSNPARLWVRAEDAQRAIELLDEDRADEALAADAIGWDEGGDSDEPTDAASGLFIAMRSDEAPGPGTLRRGPNPERMGVVSSALGGRERAVSATLSIACIGFGTGLGGLVLAPAGVLAPVLLILGVVFGLSALVGRAWGPLRGLLRALAGVA